MEIRDENGQIKSWVWIAGAAVVGIGALLLMRGGSSSSAGGVVSTGGQSSDFTDQINQLNDAVLALAGNSNVPQTTGTAPSPNPTNPQYLQDIIDQLTQGNKVLEQAQQNMLSLLTELSGYESQYTAAINKRSGLNTAREGTARRIADLKNSYKDNKIGKASYTKQLKALQSTYNTQTSQLVEVNKTIAGLEALIKSVQDKIASLYNPSP